MHALSTSEKGLSQSYERHIIQFFNPQNVYFASFQREVQRGTFQLERDSYGHMIKASFHYLKIGRTHIPWSNKDQILYSPASFFVTSMT